MKKGYRPSAGNADFSLNAKLATFTDMLGMTSGHEARKAMSGTQEIFPQYINAGQALGKKLTKKQTPDRATQKSVVNYPGSKKPGTSSTLTASQMTGGSGNIPASGQQWSNHAYHYGNNVNFNQGLTSMVGVGAKSDPYKGELDQGMPGDTHIMNPSPNVGNPYNLIKKGEPTYPTRVRYKTPVKTLKRGQV